MQLEQKQGIYKTSYTFSDTKLDYLVSISNNKSGGSVAYEKIPAQHSYRKTHRYWLVKYIALFFIFMGMFLAILGLNHGVRNSVSILLVFAGVSAVLLAVVHFYKSPLLTIIPGDPNIVVLQDGQYASIMDEIRKRRLESQRKKFMEVDFLNNPAQEYEKFRHLRNEAIISEREFSDAVAKLLASQRKPSSYVS